MNAEVISGDRGYAVCFVEHHKVVGQKDAASVTVWGHASIDQSKQQAVVDDDAVGGEEFLTCALIETSRWIAVFLRAGGALGVDYIPHLREWCGGKFLHNAVFAGGRPFGESNEFGLAFVCE